jgi:type II secretory pathway predicted ATPase ExeA
MTDEIRDSHKLGKIYARTISGRELVPDAWLNLMSDIYTFSTSCNGLMLISGSPGSGKTTFIKLLQERKPVNLDIIAATNASASPKTDWIIDAITPWLTSSRQPNQSISEKLRSLSENPRPILLCIDCTSSEIAENAVSQIMALLNLADASNLNFSSIIVLPSPASSSLFNESQILQRVTLNKKLPEFDDMTMQNFIINKIQNAGIGPELISSESALKICRDARGIPGHAIHLVASALGQEGNRTQDKKPAQKLPSKNPTPVAVKKSNSDENKKPQKIEDLLAPAKS